MRRATRPNPEDRLNRKPDDRKKNINKTQKSKNRTSESTVLNLIFGPIYIKGHLIPTMVCTEIQGLAIIYLMFSNSVIIWSSGFLFIRSFSFGLIALSPFITVWNWMDE